MNDTEKNLLEAFSNYKDTGSIQYTYRLYYDPINGDCLYTDVELHDKTFIEISKEIFDTITPVLYRIVDGKIKPRKVEYTDKRILVQGNGKYITVKGASMFLITEETNVPSSTWKINDN